MEYKKMFDDAFEKLSEGHDIADDRTFSENVRRKAGKDGMPISRKFISPKSNSDLGKRRGILYRAGIVSAAAAILLFIIGIGMLNKQTGGYEDDISYNPAGIAPMTEITSPADNDAVYYDIFDGSRTDDIYGDIENDIPEDCIYRFDEYTVKPTWYFFDGNYLTLYCNVLYNTGEYFEASELPYVYMKGSGGEYISCPREGRYMADHYAEMRITAHYERSSEEAVLFFVRGTDAEINDSSFKFTAHRTDSRPLISDDAGYRVPLYADSTDDCPIIYMEHIDIFENSVLFRFAGDDSLFDDTSDISGDIRVSVSTLENNMTYDLTENDICGITHTDGCVYLRFAMPVGVPDNGRRIVYYNDVLVYSTDVYYKTSAAIPADCIYRFDGVTVKPEWCSFDGMNLYMRSTVTYENGIPQNAASDIRLADPINEYVYSGEITFTDGNVVTRIDRLFYYTMTFVPYPLILTDEIYNDPEKYEEAVSLKNLTDSENYFTEGNYFFPVMLENGVQNLSRTPHVGIPLYSDGEISDEIILEEIDVTLNALSLIYDTSDLDYDIYDEDPLKTIDIQVILTDGQCRSYSQRDLDMGCTADGKTFVRYITESMIFNNIDIITVNGVTVFTKNAVREDEPPMPGMTNNAMQYRVNENGQTYGSIAGKLMYEYPDLVRVVGVNGVTGYVYADELEEEPPSSPEEAVQRQQEYDADPGRYKRTINVYDTDGETVIDTFIIG